MTHPLHRLVGDLGRGLLPLRPLLDVAILLEAPVEPELRAQVVGVHYRRGAIALPREDLREGREARGQVALVRGEAMAAGIEPGQKRGGGWKGPGRGGHGLVENRRLERESVERRRRRPLVAAATQMSGPPGIG